MKEFEKWMNLGMHHPMVQNYIPLGYQPTLPLIFRENEKEYVCFFYYRMTPGNGVVFLKSPKYYLQFELNSERLIVYKELEGEKDLGSTDEIFKESYAGNQIAYMECFEEAVGHAHELSDEELRDLSNVHYDTLLVSISEYVWDLFVD